MKQPWLHTANSLTFTQNIASIDIAVKLEIKREVKPDF